MASKSRNIALLLKAVKPDKSTHIKKHRRKKSSSSEPKSSKNTRKIALALWALGSICLILILGQIIALFGALYRPLTSELVSKNRYASNDNFNTNLVIKADKISVLVINPALKQLTVIKIPDDAYLDLSKGYGSWPARSVYELGQAENPRIGGKLLKSSLSELLGLPIDGVVVLKGQLAQQDVAEQINTLRKNIFAPLAYLGKIESDLTGMDLLKLSKQVASVRDDHTKIVDLSNSSITESKLLPDSTRVLGVDNVKLDLFTRDNLKELSVSNFDGGIAIFNSTEHPGLAQKIARVITNMGGNIITIGNIDLKQDKTQLVAKDGLIKNSPAFARLASIYAPRCIKERCFVDDSRVTESRAQITIVIGEDYYQQLADRSVGF